MTRLSNDSAYRQRVRNELVRNQDGKCCYCKRRFTADGPTRPTIEHKKARMDGGSDKLDNLAAACLHCNQHRGRQMDEARQLTRRYKAEQIEVSPASN
ncbi:MAG: HNH endonuclease signature motif containing protein [Xanthobacteraceae bacterium]